MKTNLIALLGHAALAAALAQTPPPADQPEARTDRNSQIAHAQLLAKARQGRIDVYFAGDSITRRWGATDYPELLANWRENFFGWNAANFGWGADTLQNILWRLTNGELDGVNPKVAVLLAGTNNVGKTVPPEGDAEKVAEQRRFGKAIRDLTGGRDPDVVFEHVGKDTFSTSVFVVKRFGKVVICGATSGYDLDFDVRYLWMRQKSIIGSHFANAYEANRANDLVVARKITTVVDDVFEFGQTPQAHQLMADNKHMGKMVIRVQAPAPAGAAK